ncbi:MAG: ABC transporter substrate-binding protein [Acidimicrobiaceae bacterium]|nr:ABC transporter substrate-binding protein [Acidimicrobiaceae bacterium]
MTKGRLIRLAAAATAVVAIAACSSSNKSGSGSAAGNNKSNGSPITVGLLTTLTGPAAAQFLGNLPGAQARIDLQNAQGGVNGHQIKLISADDQTSVTGANTAMSDLIQSKGAFAVIDLSDFTAGGAYRVAQRAGVPVVGFPSDGPEWGQKPNTNMISIEGNVPSTGIGGEVNTLYPKVAKMLGATNMADLALAGEPASDQGAQSFAKAAKSIGLKIGYTNYSIPIGTVDVTPAVLAMKQAHVDGFESGLLDNTNLALMTTARQAGLHFVAPLLAAGFSQDLLDQPASNQAAQGGVYDLFQRPVNTPNAATRTEQAAFAKYEHYTGVPSLGWTAGWVSADLLIQGLKGAGANPSHTSVLNTLHNLKGYTADGLLPGPIDLSLANFGKPPKTLCNYFAQLKGHQFVTLNGGKPICGTNVS